MRKVLITGGNSGIGLGIARAFARKGASLVIGGLTNEQWPQELLVSVLKEEGAGKVKIVESDLTTREGVEALWKGAQEEGGAIDILVNNAGMQYVAPVDDFPVEKWDQLIALNLSCAFHLIRLSLPGMKGKGWGRIINIASAHALVASPFKSAYVAAKHGLAGLTKAVALEVAEKGITCNAICPGYVKTPLVEGQIEATAKARNISPQSVIKEVMLGNQPTKAFVTIEEVAELTAYLTEEGGRSITGALLAIDGGWTAH